MKCSCSLGAHDFRVCFTPFERVLFTFPSRYSFAVGRRLVFSLGGWAPRIRTGFHVSRPTQGPGTAGGTVSRTGLSPSPARPSRRLRCRPPDTRRPSNPGGRVPRFGLLRVRSPLLAESRLISSPRGTEMFHFPRCRPPALWIRAGVAGIALRGCPIRRPTGHGPPAPRRGISPLAASFVAIRRQGIRHAPEKLGRKNQSAATRPDYRCPCGHAAPSGRGMPLLH